jgi:hypothetical protein
MSISPTPGKSDHRIDTRASLGIGETAHAAHPCRAANDQRRYRSACFRVPVLFLPGGICAAFEDSAVVEDAG